MRPDELRSTRRAFLGGLGATLLSACTVDPSRANWAWVSWAEGAWRSVLQAGGLKQRLAKEYPVSAISQVFPLRSLNLRPDYGASLATWRLRVDGLVASPGEFTLAELRRAFPTTRHITRHDCVEGWSAIAEFSGVRLSDFLAAVKPLSGARWVVFHSADFADDGTPFYGSLSLEQAAHPQTVLAYDMNGAPLTVDHGAPLRLRVPTQLGYKSTKFIHRIELVDDLSRLGRGKGGYWEDQGYEHYAGI
jgi:DMSO/TMAO reductase YedYZ molybdopterin-dependent catalytic subunit